MAPRTWARPEKSAAGFHFEFARDGTSLVRLGDRRGVLPESGVFQSLPSSSVALERSPDDVTARTFSHSAMMRASWAPRAPPFVRPALNPALSGLRLCPRLHRGFAGALARTFARVFARVLARDLARAAARFARHLSHLQPRGVMTLRK